MNRTLGFLLTASLLSVSVLAQDAPKRDSGAAATLGQVVGALGGVNIGLVRDCRAEGVIEPAEGSDLTSGKFTWKHSGREFRYENPGTSSTKVYVSGRGRPTLTAAEHTTRFSAHVAEARFVPHLAALELYQALQDPTYDLTLVGLEELRGREVLRIRTRPTKEPLMAEVMQRDWLIDNLTGLPLRVEYRLPSNYDLSSWIETAVNLADWQVVNGVAIPHQITSFIAGLEQGTARITSVVFNSGISPSEFDAPAGGNR